MDRPAFKLNQYYQILFTDGQPIVCKFVGDMNNNGSMLFEKKGGETFFLETVEPYSEIKEVEGW